MRVSKEKAAENRDALLNAANRLFRSHGIEGVGVAEIAKEAGLTHGALYAHFKSKEELAAAAFEYGFAGNMANTQKWAETCNPQFEDFLDGLLSVRMRDNLEAGCPMAASASEIGRQGNAVSNSFTRAFVEQVGWLERSLEPDIPAADRRRLAVAAIAAEIGAVAVSRAIIKTDAALANDVLDAIRSAMSIAHQVAKARVDMPRA